MGDFAPYLDLGPEIAKKMKLFRHLQSCLLRFDALLPDAGNFGRWQPLPAEIAFDNTTIVRLSESRCYLLQAPSEFAGIVIERQVWRSFKNFQLVLQILQTAPGAVQVGGTLRFYCKSPGIKRAQIMTGDVRASDVLLTGACELLQSILQCQDFATCRFEP